MNGTVGVRRYSMILPGGTFSGYVAVQVPDNSGKIYTEDAVRQMFASAIIRKEVPVEEQLSLLSFKVADLADFKVVRTLAVGSAILIADNDETTGFEPAPFMIIGPGRFGADAARRSRALRRRNGENHSGRARGQAHDVRTGPDRRLAWI